MSPREPRFSDVAYQPQDMAALLEHWEDKRTRIRRLIERRGEAWVAKDPGSEGYARGQLLVTEEVCTQLHRLVEGSHYSQRKRKRVLAQ